MCGGILKGCLNRNHCWYEEQIIENILNVWNTRPDFDVLIGFASSNTIGIWGDDEKYKMYHVFDVTCIWWALIGCLNRNHWFVEESIEMTVKSTPMAAPEQSSLSWRQLTIEMHHKCIWSFGMRILSALECHTCCMFQHIGNGHTFSNKRLGIHTPFQFPCPFPHLCRCK